MRAALTLREHAPLLAGLAAAAALAGGLRHAARVSSPLPVDLIIDVPPIPAVVAQPLAFGFRSLLGDFTFLEAIQVLAQRKGELTYLQSVAFDRRLQRLIEYSIDVDPKFSGAYRFGGYALPHETTDGKTGGVLAAVQILQAGTREVPEDWRIGLSLGFLQSYYLRDYVHAAATLGQAAKQPGAPRYLGFLATRLAAQGGELQMATLMAEGMLAQATEEENRNEWEKRVADLHMERDLRLLAEAVRRFRESHEGAPPRPLRALVQAGILPAIPREPHGGEYLLDEAGQPRSTVAGRLMVYGSSANLEVH